MDDDRHGAPRERRRHARHPFAGRVGLVLEDRGGPLLLHAVDLSVSGVQVQSSTPLTVGARGAMQMVRSDGRFALLGVEVRHCRYDGERRHGAGLAFGALPPSLPRERFVDAHGRLALIDPLLRIAADG